MNVLSENQEYAISKFLQKYDYNSVLDILEEAGIITGDLYFLIALGLLSSLTRSSAFWTLGNGSSSSGK